MAERRHRILEAARQLIESEGYERLKMRDLAEASDVTVPTIYNLIGNKEQVLLAAVEEQTAAFVAGLERESGDLIAVAEATVRQLQRRPRYYRSLLLALANSNQAAGARRFVWRALADQIDRAVAELSSEGDLVDWVDEHTLKERLHARIDATAIEWARGTLTAVAFRSAALFDVSTTMIGVTRGERRDRFERIAQEHQAEARGFYGANAKGRAA